MLDAAKNAKEIADTIKNPFSLLGLFKFVDPSLDVLAALAFILALLKDLFDITLGFIPIVGDFLSFLFAIFYGISMFLISILLGTRRFSSVIRQMGIISGGTFLELFPATDYLPIETFTFLLSYFCVLIERKFKYQQDKKQREKEKQEVDQNKYAAA